MASSAIVERVDVIGDVLDRGVSVFVNVFLDPLFLETAEEGFSYRVIPTIASAAHAGLKMVRFAITSPGIVTVLRALVRMDQRAARSSTTDGHQNGIEHQLTMDRCTSRPANDPSRVKVHDDGQIQPTLPGADIGYIRDPDTIGRGHGKLSFEQIRNQHRWLAYRDMPRLITVQGAKTILSHEALDTVVTAGFASLSQIQKHARCTVDAVTGDKRGANQAQKPRILYGTIRNRIQQPFVVAAWRNLKHLAHCLDRKFSSMRFNELAGSADPSCAHSLGHYRLPGLWKSQFSCIR
jgi:hypothetical protein